MAVPAELVCAGDRLATADQFVPGPGTYVKDGSIFASLIGVQQATPSEGSQKPTLAVVSRQRQPLVPEPGSIVTAKVSRVTPTQAYVRIMCVGNTALDTDFKGAIRLQDVRQTEVDQVVMYECFRPGDVIRAEVVSLGDARSYHLTTARNELGVVYALSTAGVPMVPISWQEMQDPETRAVERRKVAKV